MISRYNVLIEIGEFRNRGDFMMMETACEQVRRRLPGATLSVPFRLFNENPAWCIAQGLIPLATLPRHLGRRLRLRCDHAITRHVLRRNSFLLPDEIDLVLYAVGYRYSDHFACYYSEASVRDEESYVASFTKRGRRFVFMPQAFGPFKTELAQRKMLGLYRYADLVFARDATSYEYLREIVPNAGNLIVSPDFTCLCAPKPDRIRFPRGRYVVFIPNQRMVTHMDPASSAAYLPFCQKIVEALLVHGEQVVLLNHQAEDDEELIAALNEKFGGVLSTLDHLTGSGCKDVIARSKLVVSSRFHGVVSGLVTGVPTFCTSWSHKYDELMKSHGCPENVLSVRDPEKAIRKVLDACEHPGEYCATPDSIKSLGRSVQDMWERVMDLVPPIAASARPLGNIRMSKLWR